jgi:hypothetical protein
LDEHKGNALLRPHSICHLDTHITCASLVTGLPCSFILTVGVIYAPLPYGFVRISRKWPSGSSK